ncbi:MAG: class I SAM-dependent methyltransferase, partial [Actinomycetota bacterium]|nr:class I SAM-dependent methyltransferase [Actinomycetota bacterium]
LEVGVGTGLVALPLADAGVPMVGVDLSAPMLGKLVEKAGRRLPFPLVRADATRLPFADDAFGSALVRHVLHLISAWERVVAELARVVRRGGTVLVATGDIPAAWREVTERFVGRVGRPSFARGLDLRELDRLDEAFATHGGVPRNLPKIPDRVGQSLGTFIEQMADGLHSWTWDVPEGVRRDVAEEIREWALERYGTLDPPEARDVAIEWRAYDLS